MPEPEYEDLLDAGQAAQYLAKKWGIPSYSAEAFKMLRHRWNIEPAILISNASLWRKSDLDTIPKPDRTRARGKRRQEKKDEIEGTDLSSMMLIGNGQPREREAVA